MTAPDDDNDEADYGLVMPFVVCQSEGGPYESQAFVSGVSCGVIDETLRQLAALAQHGLTAATVERYVAPALLPQLDLVAMRHGFTLTSEAWDEHPDEWALATFTKQGADE